MEHAPTLCSSPCKSSQWVLWVVSLQPETPSGGTRLHWKRPVAGTRNQLETASFFFLKASGTEKATKGKKPLVGTGLWPETPSRGKPTSARQDPPQQIPTVKNTMPKGNSGVHENATKHLKQACSTSRWQNKLTALAGPKPFARTEKFEKNGL